MILSGDVGGTKTLLGVFEPAASRPRLVTTASYVTNAYHSFTDILDEFDRIAAQHGTIDAVAVGVAGPVIGGVSRLTNISWDISAAEIRTHRGIRHVELLNDLEAIANSVELLTGDEVAVLQPGVSRTDGNGAVIAPHARLDDGLLDLVIVAARSLVRAFVELPFVFMGVIDRLGGVRIQQTDSVTIASAYPLVYHVDGEPIVGTLRISAKARPRALRVRVPVN